MPKRILITSALLDACVTALSYVVMLLHAIADFQIFPAFQLTVNDWADKTCCAFEIVFNMQHLYVF
jgi:hypothetical protein